MRLKLALATAISVLPAPAFAHPDHGFQLPNIVHTLTEPDHLAMLLVALVVAAIVGRIAFNRFRK